ncbi:MAG: hypothetical protein AAFX78_00160 [Cyanobacteria bacterium J06638_20]
MKVKLRPLLLEVFCWLAAELILGFLGFDDLADYGEYLQDRNAIAAHLVLKLCQPVA